MMSAVIARIALALVAVLVLGWLGLSYRSAGQQQEAEAILRKPLAGYLAGDGAQAPDPAELRRATGLVDRARRLNPDTTLDLDMGSLQLLAGFEPQAVQTFRGVVEGEPDNLQGWLALAIAARRSDPALARRANRRADELNPIRSRGR